MAIEFCHQNSTFGKKWLFLKSSSNNCRVIIWLIHIKNTLAMYNFDNLIYSFPQIPILSE
jgi:hypothetical protein